MTAATIAIPELLIIVHPFSSQSAPASTPKVWPVCALGDERTRAWNIWRNDPPALVLAGHRIEPRDWHVGSYEANYQLTANCSVNSSNRQIRYDQKFRQYRHKRNNRQSRTSPRRFTWE
jgi:hypothetical protein